MLEGRARRRQLISEIEGLRGSRLITYVTSDRDNCQGQIDENVVRPMYDHLLELNRAGNDHGDELPQLDLLLYSRGGAVDAPWRIVSMIRSISVGFAVLVPFRAQSAATMIALGADEVVLGRKGELGPIDPSLSVQRQGAGGALIDDRINVEDVMAYVQFVRDKAGITDQSGLAAALAALTEYPGPLILGTIYRTHSHIRSVAERLLESREAPFDDQKNQLLINTLAERTYAHGHAIGRNEAAEMGLPVVSPEPELERLMWELFVEYERALYLNDPVDPVAYLNGAEERSEPVTLALVESTWGLSTYDGLLTVKAMRNLPEELSVDLNLHVQMPDSIDISTLNNAESAALQSFVEGLQAHLLETLEKPVHDEIARQAPIVDYAINIAGLKWTQRDPGGEGGQAAAGTGPTSGEQEAPTAAQGMPSAAEPAAPRPRRGAAKKDAAKARP